MTKLYLLNTSIIPNEGEYSFSRTTVSPELFEGREVVSAIGHASTAEVMTTLLGFNVEVNRIAITMEVGESALVLKLNNRLREGKIITAEEMEVIGYAFYILERTA